MSETNIVSGRFTYAQQVSELLSAKVSASADSDIRLSINLSKNFIGTIVLQSSPLGTDIWTDLTTYTKGGSYNDLFTDRTDYRLYCSSILARQAVSYDLFANSTSRRIDYISPQFSRAVAAWGSSAAGLSAVAKTAGTLAFPSIRNAKPSNMKQLRQAKARINTGAGNGAILFVGMSLDFGQGAGTGTNGLTGCKAKSIPTKLATKLTARGLTAQAHSWFGSGAQATAADLTLADPRLVFNSGWAVSTSFTTIAKYPFLNSTNTNNLTFTPSGNVDSFRTYYGRGSAGDTVAQQIDSETAQNFSTQGSSLVIADTVVSGTGAGTKVLKLRRTGALTNAFVIGCRAWDSTATALECINMGWPSSSASNWEQNNSALYPLSAVEAVITDLLGLSIPVTVFLGVDLNDAIAIKNGTRTVAEYTASMQTLISGYRAAGADVVLVTGNPMTSIYDNGQTQTIQAQHRLADYYDIPIIDIFNRFGSYDEANAIGLMYDTIHPNDRGYDDQATLLANFILNI